MVQHVPPKISVLIATRNRPTTLERCLASIEDLKINAPWEVIVVSSGDDVTNVINKFKKIKIIHKHLTTYGQIRQKMAGVKLVSVESEWVLFLDDDVYLFPDAISQALNSYESRIDQGEIKGIGFSSYSTKPKELNPNQVKKMRRSKYGSVMRSGRNLDYMEANEPVLCEWLNGISMWKRDVLCKYSFDYLDSRYSICEDLIFSYSISRDHKLLYVPNAVFNFQTETPIFVTNREVFRANAYWRLFFVSSNSQLSKYRFLITQFIRSFTFSFRNNLSFRNKFADLVYSNRIFLDCCFISLYRLQPLEILKTRKV